MKNLLIRQEAKRSGVALWEVAEALGIADSTLYRQLRREFPEEKQKKAFRYEVLAVVHQYGPMEPPKAETAWEKRVQQAAEGAFGKFCFEDCAQLIQHHRSGRTHETLAAAFSIGYQAGREEAGRE